ncbi:glycoside hydrolase family 26 protein [Karstenula rhodostoma CBS 690.94]|uniref:Glycoside hydrolase family 26 protein n=1 Tax=Karstenula rhodostoma CBS 690.94 TaxID=1392251 RepID=A0A9P4U5S4_9PLEO|nr:glycoside hydrolase family 26 protein [Karstenula rhodostoma CBS 690.94]
MAASLGSSMSVRRAGNYPIESNPGFASPGSHISKRASKDLGLPDDTLKTNCLSIGFLPSEGDSASPRYTMAQINDKLGAKASTYGWYAQITSSGFDGSQLLAVKDDIVASGAVFVASVMPSVNFNQITPDIASQVAAVMKQFTDAGVTVWLRYAHEMNWYVSDGTYHGTAADFLTSWKTIYNAACKDNAKVSCFWSPNQAGSAADLAPWWPGDEYVDLVGIDCYPRSEDDTASDALFDRLYGAFYDAYSKPYGLPFAIGETGAGKGQKDQWLQTLVSQDKNKYPNYVSMSWFEFDKEADFQIVMTDDATLQRTKATLLSGGNELCGAGNGTAPPPPPGQTSAVATVTSVPVQTATATSAAAPANSGAACDWGCWGWDCSASVPCQEAWTCKGGYCK